MDQTEAHRPTYEELEAQLGALHAQSAIREQVAAALQDLGEGVTAQDGSGRLIYANVTAARLIGYPSVQELLATPPHAVLDQFDLLDEHGAPISATELPGRRALIGESGEERLFRFRIRATGEERWTSVRAKPILGADGDVRFALTLFRDLTERMRAEAERERLLAETERALHEAEAAILVRDQFLSIASHELRTPLTPLRGILQIMQRQIARGGSPAQLTSSVEVAQRQVERLIRLVSAMLDVSRITTGRLTQNRAPMALLPLVRQVVAMQRLGTNPARPINLIAPACDPVVSGDADRVEQVLVNLMENAIKYSADGSPVEVCVGCWDQTVTVAVKDQGIEIPPAEQELIFERFHRGSNVDPGVSGLGLGLTIIQEIIREHEGELSVRSAPGEGSTFTVTLPRLLDPVAGATT